MSQIIVNGELTVDFGWRIFRSEILENQLIKQALANRLVFNRENGIQVFNYSFRILAFLTRLSLSNSSDDNEIVDYKERSFFVNLLFFY